jgi:hypothetical protein
MDVTQDRRPHVHSPTLQNDGVNDEQFNPEGSNRPYHYHF